jgi:rhodanese-related sulfurtransferase
MARKNIPVLCISMLLLSSFAWGAFDSITPAQLHQRLINKDTLLILDVREWTAEYKVGHIAEPAGQLPLTPACMPWTSGVLRANYQKLPKNVDIVVHCRSGVRSRAASTFLADSGGFTRIFNMLGGFNAWTYEHRSGGFGDTSGAWIHPSMAKPVTITKDSGSLMLYPAAVSGMDSVYCEVHLASGKQPSPTDAPISAVNGLFRVTAFDKFGLSLFKGDSLTLHDTVSLDLAPRVTTQSGPGPALLTNFRLSALAGRGTWLTLSSTVHNNIFHRSELVLRQWYNAQASLYESVLNPPDSRPVKVLGRISAPLYDLRGRRLSGAVATEHSWRWVRSSGYYIFGAEPKQLLNDFQISR